MGEGGVIYARFASLCPPLPVWLRQPTLSP